MTNKSLIDLAMGFAKAGYRIFPCTQEKVPLISSWPQNSTNEPDKIEAIFANPLASLIGMPTGGANGVCVLDIDQPKKVGAVGGFPWLELNKHKLPETRVVQTQNAGLHYYFRHIEGLKSTAGKIHAGVDLRAEGGMVIVGGYGYEIINSVPLDQLPSFPLEILSDDYSRPSQRQSRHHDLGQIFQPGMWHNTVRNWTAAAVSRGDSEQTILEIAPLITLPTHTIENTERELKTFLDGAAKKGFAPATKEPSKNNEFKLKGLKELMELEDPSFIVEDMIVDNSFAMVFVLEILVPVERSRFAP